MDFVTGLPKSKLRHDAIWEIVDRLTKSAHFLPVSMTLVQVVCEGNSETSWSAYFDCFRSRPPIHFKVLGRFSESHGYYLRHEYNISPSD